MRAWISVRRAGGALLVAAALTTSLAACGDSDDDTSGKTPSSVASGDVARVADQGIGQARFDRALASRVSGISPLTPGQSATPLDAPDFTRCVRAVLRTAAPDAPPPARAQLKANCAAQYQQARAATMTALIQEQWIDQQAASQGIDIDAKTVDATLAQYRAAAGLRRDGKPLPAAKAKERFTERLKASGLTLADVREQLTAQLAQSAIQQKQAQGAAPPSPAAARAFLKANPQLFGTPGTATVEIVVAPSQAGAAKAAKALRDGKPVAAVRQSVAAAGQPATAQGSVKISQGDGQLPKAVEAKVFAARDGAVVGPVQDGAQHYVVRVQRARAGTTPPYREVKDKVLRQYAAQQAQTAQVEAQAKLAATWRPKTLCAKGYVVPQCSNGPKLPAQ